MLTKECRLFDVAVARTLCDASNDGTEGPEAAL